MEIYVSALGCLGCLVVGAVGCLLIILFPILQYWCKRRSSTSGPLPPGSSGFLEYLKYLNAHRSGELSRFVSERTAKFSSKTFKTSVFFHPTVVVQGVAANRFIAAAENKQQVLNSWPANILALLGKHTPVVQHGASHRRLRQIMASCLAPLGLRKLVGRADHMTNLHFATCWQAERQLSLQSVICEHTFWIACGLLAGIEDEVLVAKLCVQFKRWTEGLASLPLDVPGTTYAKAKRAKKVLEGEMGKVIDSKVKSASLEEEEDHQHHLLAMLLRARDENGSFLGRQELLDVILLLLFAGHDTTTVTLCFLLKFLEQNPACYHRLLQEHNAIYFQKNRGDSLRWEDVQNMKYTWALIQETLRIRPPIGNSFKEVKHDANFDGYMIPKGWKITFNMISTHYDESFFPEPSKFDPLRFDIGRIKEGHGPPPYAYIPFGIGPHSCPGGDFARMIMSIYLHHLVLRKIKWTSIDPNEKVYVFPTPKLVKGYPVNISLE